MNWPDEQSEYLRRREDCLDAMRFIGYGVVFATLVALVRWAAGVVFG